MDDARRAALVDGNQSFAAISILEAQFPGERERAKRHKRQREIGVLKHGLHRSRHFEAGHSLRTPGHGRGIPITTTIDETVLSAAIAVCDGRVTFLPCAIV